MITSKSDPVFGGVYKLCAVKDSTDEDFIPKIKISENVEKITNPGKKKLWRIFSRETGYAVADLITFYDEEVKGDEPFAYVDPKKPWKKMEFKDVDVKELQVPVFRNGELVYKSPDLKEIKAFVADQLKNKVWEEEQRYENPHVHYVDLSKKLYDTKVKMLEDNQQ